MCVCVCPSEGCKRIFVDMLVYKLLSRQESGDELCACEIVEWQRCKCIEGKWWVGVLWHKSRRKRT
uniref:Uncharacterized protein n=1 Tax=Octopus bimaculoides TaxID=37653 RepID=A0A0L8FMU6_OCTBM